VVNGSDAIHEAQIAARQKQQQVACSFSSCAAGFEVAFFAFQTADSQEFRARAQSKTVLVLEFGVSMTITSTISLSTSWIP
jgi:hypothetical protein